MYTSQRNRLPTHRPPFPFFSVPLLHLFAFFALGSICPAIAQTDAPVSSSSTSQELLTSLDRNTKLDYSIEPIALNIELPELTRQEKLREEETLSSRRFPLQIGSRQTISDIHRLRVSQTMAQDWTQANDGSVVKSFTYRSLGASALRAAIVANLPTGGEIRFFSPRITELRKKNSTAAFLETAADHFPVITKQDFHVTDGSQEPLWSPTVRGDSLGIEISLASFDDVKHLSFDVADLSRIYGPMPYLLGDLSQPKCGNHIDVMCRQEGRNIEASVARIRYIKDGNAYLCSGTLLADEDMTEGYYFLTAHHCISTHREARSVEAIWSDQQVTCDLSSRSLNFIRTSPKARLVATRAAQDATLLEFTGDIPKRFTLSGWTANGVERRTNVYGIHHPRGAAKKYSSGVVAARRRATICGDLNDDSTCIRLPNAIRVHWSGGTTEPGSSGSGLFVEGKLVGILSGDNRECETGKSTYGPFGDFFPLIERWLKPSGG